MEEFYANLWTKKRPKQEALRQAQITLLHHPDRLEAQQQALATEVADRGLTGRIKQYSDDPTSAASAALPRRTHPAYWAAFVLSGNPD